MAYITKLAIPALLISLLFSCASNEDNISEAQNSDPVISIDYAQIGDSITQIAQQNLLMNVGREIQIGGPVNAVEFCSINASPIMDSLSELYGATISRVSELNRNVHNAASSEELNILNDLESLSKKDTVVNSTYYKTIRLGMPACLKCHGTPNTDISPETLNILNEKYPADKATGYSLGDFRGAWKVNFDK